MTNPNPLAYHEITLLEYLEVSELLLIFFNNNNVEVSESMRYVSRNIRKVLISDMNVPTSEDYKVCSSDYTSWHSLESSCTY